MSTPSPRLEDLVLEAESESLEAIVGEAVRGVEPEAQKRKIALTLKVVPEVASRLVASGEKLIQVLTNLLLNAISVSREGGSVVVSVAAGPEKPRRCALLAVQDSGPGIPESERSRLFRRGYSKRTGGAGIGLSQVHAHAIEEGGLITVAPYEPNVGARFELCWPTSDPVGASTYEGGAPPPTIRGAHLDGFRVAVLDDDPAVIELLDTVLHARGAEVFSAKSLDELREIIQRERPDVALVDASPLGNQLEEALRDLRAAFPKTDYVLISGAPDPGAAAERLSFTWLRKPFEVSEVVDVLRVVRGTSRSDR